MTLLPRSSGKAPLIGIKQDSKLNLYMQALGLKLGEDSFSVER